MDEPKDGENEKKENPISVYAVVSQIAFMVITPLLIFIWGGSWLIDKLDWPDWVMIICVVLGIAVMLSSVGNYLAKLIKMYGGKDKKRSDKLMHDKKDHDYYDRY